MIESMLLVSWIVVGLGLASRMRAPGDSWWAVVPLAATFGPLWPAIALERRLVDPARDLPVDR